MAFEQPAASPVAPENPGRLPLIDRVAVLGAGTMGAQIAAHFANAGVPALLLDLSRDVARAGLERAMRLKPDPFFTASASGLVTTGGFDTDLAEIARADWIVEAVVERLDVKRELLARVEPVRRRGTIVSTNTSGIPIGLLAEGRSPEFRAHWVGTHFFNPPRYLRLLEVIPSADTDAAVVAAVTRFADRRLGKGTVVARDTPSFIGNRVALHGVMLAIRALESGRYSIEEIDAISGPAIGRPKSATLRTMDIAGLDVLAHVTRNLQERLTGEDRAAFTITPLLEALVSRGAFGEKAGRGFYKREKGATGESQILVLDTATLDYRPRQPVRLPSIDAARSIEDVSERVRTLFAGNGQGRRLPARDARAHARLRRRGGAVDRPLDRRRGPRDAVGLRLGAGAVRADRCDWRAGGGGRVAGVGAPRRAGPGAARGTAPGRHAVPARTRGARRPGPAGARAAPETGRASSGRMPAPASWTWATACSASSSTRR